MRIIALTGILFFWIFIPGMGQLSADEPVFDFIREDNDISLWYRWITAGNNRQTREIKAEFRVRAGKEEILKLIKNEEYTLKWMKGVKEYSVLNQEDADNWIVYLRYEFPWPIKSQDCIIQYRCLEKSGSKSLRLSLTGIPDYIPIQPGVDRIMQLSGSWEITAISSGQCKVEYRIFSCQKAKFPRWMADPVVQSSMINSMASFRELAEKNNGFCSR